MPGFFRGRRLAAAPGPVILLGILAASCGTLDDNGLGVRLIEDQAGIKAVRRIFLAAPDSVADFQEEGQPEDVGTAPTLAVGSAPGYLVRGLLQFDAQALPDSGTTIDSASVLLVLDDEFGSAASLPVGVLAATIAWAEGRIDPDTLSFFETAPPDTQFLPDGSPGDSVLVSVTSVVQFLIDHPDSDFGLALVPTDATDLLLEFRSRGTSDPPLLTVSWSPGGKDTSSTLAPTQDVFMISKTADFVPLAGRPRRLTVARGIPAGVLMRFPIPDLGERATVNRAVLTIHLDPALSRLNDFAVRFRRVTGTVWQAESTAVDPGIHGLTTVSAQSDSVQFEVGSLVRDVNRLENLGFLMEAQERRSDTDYFRFHSRDTEVSGKAPSLRIWYTPGTEEASP